MPRPYPTALGSVEPRARLTAPLPLENFNVILEFEEPFSTFYERCTQLILTPEDEQGDSLANRVASMDPDEAVVMAVEAITDMISHGGEFHGIDYTDIYRLRRNSDVRAMIYSEAGTRDTYVPKMSPTEDYHLNLLQEHIAQVIEKHFEGAVRQPVQDVFADTVLWQLLTSLILEIAAAVSAAGRQLGISQASLLSYEFKGGDTHGTVPYAYVLYLQH